MGDVAALLGGADELLDRRIGEVEQWAVPQGLGKRPVLNNADRHFAGASLGRSEDIGGAHGRVDQSLSYISA